MKRGNIGHFPTLFSHSVEAKTSVFIAMIELFLDKNKSIICPNY